MGHITGYSLIKYGQFITNPSRMIPYTQALRQAVQPGCVVLDIGAGTGIFSLLACEFGAGHVHAVEPNDIIQIAQQSAKDNGYAGRMTFHQALSTEVDLPIPADVIISDLRGVLPLFEQHIPAIIDARRRLLAPGGTLIPLRDTVWAALIKASTQYESYCEPWLRNSIGMDLSAGYPIVVNSWHKSYIEPEQLVLPPLQLATLDYSTIASPDLSGALTWSIETPTVTHGILIWFDTVLAPNAGFSNAPGKPDSIYGQAFFPFKVPQALEAGDTIDVTLRADLTGGDYVWQWHTRVYSGRNSDKTKVDFHQSTFYGIPISMSVMRKREAGYRPERDEGGQLELFVLSMMDGKTTLAEMAGRLVEAFPTRFEKKREALAFAGKLSVKYSR